MRDGALLSRPRTRADRRLPRTPGRTLRAGGGRGVGRDRQAGARSRPSSRSPIPTTPGRAPSARRAGSATRRRSAPCVALEHLWRYARDRDRVEVRVSPTRVFALLLVDRRTGVRFLAVQSDVGTASGRDQPGGRARGTPLWSPRRVPQPFVDLVGAQNAPGRARPGGGRHRRLLRGATRRAAPSRPTRPTRPSSPRRPRSCSRRRPRSRSSAPTRRSRRGSSRPRIRRTAPSTASTWSVGVTRCCRPPTSAPRSTSMPITGEPPDDEARGPRRRDRRQGRAPHHGRHRRRRLPLRRRSGTSRRGAASYRTDGSIGPLGALTREPGLRRLHAAPSGRRPRPGGARGDASSPSCSGPRRRDRRCRRRAARRPTGAVEVAKLESPPLKDIVHEMLTLHRQSRGRAPGARDRRPGRPRRARRPPGSRPSPRS